MIGPWVVIFAVIISVFLSIGFGEIDSRITIEDINVGDRLKIKGEMFTVKGYTENGLMEIEKSKGVTYIIKFDKDVKFISANSSGVRQYIEVKNFKGTVGSDYLNKLKM